MTNPEHHTDTLTEPTMTETMKRFIVTRHAQGVSTAAAVDELLNRFETLHTYIQQPGVDAKAYRKKRIVAFSTYWITHPKFPKKFIPVWDAAKKSVEPDITAKVIQLERRVTHLEAELVKTNRLMSQALNNLMLSRPVYEIIESLQRQVQAAEKRKETRHH